MHVRIRLFAMLRERAGTSELQLELPDDARVSDALAAPAVAALAEGLPLVLAVNREYASGEQPLAPGDELALVPPVSGGAGEPDAAASDAADAPPAAIHVRVTGEPLLLDPLVARVRDTRAGALVTFSGVTRDVPSLVYEAYGEMALEQMAAIVREAVASHGLCAAAAEHRIGTVPLSEPSVLVAVSAPHRPEAFAGAREIIDRIKAAAPIWKQEVDETGAATWVDGTTPPTA
ncbi:molybdenum cofactor biosynthesis protein MoaE [Conexibacter sp. JD483]|uniref:molybdenum cofactor biosynthesis protein n=1 Tax=unclassified Conexibacter TaxID=2627773 RepID=UPI002718438F|nr:MULTISPECIES: molybdenum cofactor biosynthesis protein MoaE [unclassified Conexibacter]MDO8184033.1 molybdenum cofactor biosynthesis protein MoaE [Conexibacter sp. CPCC 205706]MDO8197025.1 molybdenum cofactor biosynthesis protein MoaE [Conexibacter sp. CPCC 205762]MDR9367941.1 molybdenum cofactor biosynthesis protein MoaE [Conexibacter sp. JD483]